MKTKRMIALALAVLMFLLTFAGCAQAPMTVQGPTLDKLTPTDKLVIYTAGSRYPWMQRQVELYERLYDVDVEVVTVAVDAYAERVTGDLAGGAGPDVLFLELLPNTDIAKAALNNNFLDLTEILASDEDFSEDDYVAGVFDTGRFKGRQYVIPTTFTTPLYLSAKSGLEDIGFVWESVEKTSDFLEEIARIMQDSRQRGSPLRIMSTKNMLFDFFGDSGIRLIDYENNVVLPDEAALDEFLHAYKTYFPYDYDESGLIFAYSAGANELVQSSYYFWPEAGNNIERISENIDTLIENDVGYVLQYFPGQTGETYGDVYGKAAISASSKNQLNAYNFIKMLLSAEVQCDRKLRTNGIPVLKEAHETIILGKTQWTTTTKDGQSFTYSGYRSKQLSNEELDSLLETLTHVDRFNPFVSYNLFSMMKDSMLPFFKDEKSYENCRAELKNKLTFYLSE